MSNRIQQWSSMGSSSSSEDNNENLDPNFQAQVTTGQQGCRINLRTRKPVAAKDEEAKVVPMKSAQLTKKVVAHDKAIKSLKSGFSVVTTKVDDLQADVGSLFKDIEDHYARIRSFENWKQSFTMKIIIMILVLFFVQCPVTLLISSFYLYGL